MNLWLVWFFIGGAIYLILRRLRHKHEATPEPTQPSPLAREEQPTLSASIPTPLPEVPASAPQAEVMPEELFAAISDGNTSRLRELIDAGADVNVVDNHGFTPLQRALQSGNLDAVEKLLLANANVNAETDAGVTPLDIAIATNNAVAVRMLLAAKANPSRGNPLAAASSQGNLSAVELLLGNHASVNAMDSHGWSALHRAAAEGHTAVVERLLVYGADLWAKTPQGFTARDLATLGNHESCLTAILIWEPLRPPPTGWQPTPPPEEKPRPTFDVSRPAELLAALTDAYFNGEADELRQLESGECKDRWKHDPVFDLEGMYQALCVALDPDAAPPPVPYRSGPTPREQRERWLTEVQEAYRVGNARTIRDAMRNLRRSGRDYQIRIPPLPLVVTRSCVEDLHRYAREGYPDERAGFVVERVSYTYGHYLGIHDVERWDVTNCEDIAQIFQKMSSEYLAGPMPWIAHAFWYSRRGRTAAMSSADRSLFLSAPFGTPTRPFFPELPDVIIAVDGSTITDIRAYGWEWNDRWDSGMNDVEGQFVAIELRVI